MDDMRKTRSRVAAVYEIIRSAPALLVACGLSACHDLSSPTPKAPFDFSQDLLAPIPALDRAVGYAIGADGKVVGTAYQELVIEQDKAARGVLWLNPQTPVPLDPPDVPPTLQPGWYEVWAHALNEVGDVAGWVHYIDGVTHAGGAAQAFRRWADGRFELLPRLLEYKGSFAYGINNAGDVVGCSGSSEYNEASMAVLWPAGGGMLLLGGLAPTPTKEDCANAINNHGVIAGTASTATGAEHAVIWRGAGEIVDLDTLPGFSSHAWAINERGEVAGDLLVPEIVGKQPAKWSADGKVTLLGAPGGVGTYGRGLGINDLGDVVGYALASGREHAMFWPHEGGAFDLSEIVSGTRLGRVTGSHANSVSDNGDVTGYIVTLGLGTVAPIVWHYRRR